VDKIENRRSTVMSLLYGGDSELCERDKPSYTIIQLLIILPIMLLLLSVVIYSIVITGIARTTIVKDNGSDALTITNYNIIIDNIIVLLLRLLLRLSIRYNSETIIED
jgi:hypothetical protein